MFFVHTKSTEITKKFAKISRIFQFFGKIAKFLATVLFQLLQYVKCILKHEFISCIYKVPKESLKNQNLNSAVQFSKNTFGLRLYLELLQIKIFLRGKVLGK